MNLTTPTAMELFTSLIDLRGRLAVVAVGAGIATGVAVAWYSSTGSEKEPAEPLEPIDPQEAKRKILEHRRRFGFIGTEIGLFRREGTDAGDRFVSDPGVVGTDDRGQGA